MMQDDVSDVHVNLLWSIDRYIGQIFPGYAEISLFPFQESATETFDVPAQFHSIEGLDSGLDIIIRHF
jgi:hypothetical protein